MNEPIQQISVLASFRDGALEAVVYKNGGDPVFYKLEKMQIEDIKDYLSNLGKDTLKI